MNIKNITIFELAEVVEACASMPDFFIEELMQEIESRCFSRLRKGETKENRRETIKVLVASVVKSKKEYLVRRFTILALNSSKTGDDIIFDLLTRLYNRYEQVFISQILHEANYTKEYSIVIVKVVTSFLLNKMRQMIDSVRLDDKNPDSILPITEHYEQGLDNFYVELKNQLTVIGE